MIRNIYITIAVLCLLLNAAAYGNPDGQNISTGTQATLRQAVARLAEIFPDSYPADEVLSALDKYSDDQDAEAFAVLQWRALVELNPLLNRQPLLFVERRPYAYDHHNTHNFSPGAPNEFCSAGLLPGATLKMIDFSRGGRCSDAAASLHFECWA